MKPIRLRFVCLFSIVLLCASLTPVFAQGAGNCSFNSSAWMKLVPGSTPICKLSIPGTHDSGATRGGEALRTQGREIAAQLHQGIRAFDIRLQKKGSMLGIYHSVAFQGIYWEQDVLPAFIRFLEENPSETLIVSLKKEGGAQEDYVMLLARSLNDDRNKPYFITDFHPGITLDECRGKILFLHRESLEGQAPGVLCQNWADNATCLLTLKAADGNDAFALLQDEYQYESDKGAGKKLGTCLHNLKAVAAEPSGSQRWGISFASATGLPDGTPQAFADLINAPLAEYVGQHGLHPCGIVFIDFVDQEGGGSLVARLIENNFAKP